MYNVPIELQYAILDRIDPDIHYSAHQVNKTWRCYILEKDDKLRREPLSEKRMLLLKTKYRAAIKYSDELAALEKELKMVQPRVVKWIEHLAKESIDNALQMGIAMEEVLTELEAVDAPSLIAKYKATQRLAKIVCHYSCDYFKCILYVERIENGRKEERMKSEYELAEGDSGVLSDMCRIAEMWEQNVPLEDSESSRENICSTMKAMFFLMYQITAMCQADLAAVECSLC